MKHLIRVLTSLLVLTLCINTARATTITWTNTNGGNWNVAANWNPNQVPGSNDTANITTAGTYAVTLNVSANVNSLTLGGAASGVQTLQGNGFTLTATNAAINSGGVLNFTSSTTFTGKMGVASGGQIELFGNTLFSQGYLWVQSGGLLNASSYLEVSTALTNAGTINLTNNGMLIYNNGVNTAGGVVNQTNGTINLVGGASITGESGDEYLINQGTINVTNAGGSSTIDVENLAMQGVVSNLAGSGALTIETFNGLGSLTGMYNAAAGTVIEFKASTTFGTSAGAGLTLGGSGVYEFNNGLLTLTNNTIPNLEYTGGTVVLGSNFQGGTVTNLTLSGTTLSNSLPVTGTLVLNGNCTVYGTVTVPSGGQIELFGNTLFSQGYLWVQSGGLLNASSYLEVSTALTNAGTINLTNNGMLIYNNGVNTAGGVVNQTNGTINLVGGASITGESGDEYLINQGTINVTNAGGSSTIDVENLAMQGVVSNLAGSGALTIETFNGLGSLTGMYNAAAGTVIEFKASTTFGTSAGAGLTLGGSGVYEFNNGLLTLTNNTIPNLEYTGGTVVLGSNFQGGTVTNLTLSGTTLSNSLPVTGTLVLNGNCTVYGTVTVPSGGQIELFGNTLFSQGYLWVQSGGLLNASSYLEVSTALTNAGTINLTNNGMLIYNNGVNTAGGVVNQTNGTINLVGGAGITGESGDEYLINQGTINVTNAGGSSTIDVENLAMQGVVSNLAGSGALTIETFNGLGSLTGMYNAAAGTVIEFKASTTFGTSAGAGLTLGGSGVYEFNNGLLTLTNNTIPNLEYTGGTVVLGSNFQGGTVTNLTLSGTTLTNSLPVTGTLVLNGNCTVYGTVTVPSGGQIELFGNTLFSQGYLWVQSGGLLNASSYLEVSTALTNAGTINLTNNGMLIYNNGVNTAGGVVNQTNGTINLVGGASITGESGDEYLINQGTINVFSANGTSIINVDNFSNFGTLSAQHGTLQLEGTHLTLPSSETLSVGLNSATDFGSITFYESTNLNLAQAGTFLVTLNGGYVPAVGSSFKVLSANSSGTFSGAFTNFSSPDGAIWKTNYTATSLILTNVGQITWATPTNITYGAALGSNQLNAATTPSVAGAFAYNPVAGTVLNSGAGQMLTTTFTSSVAGDAPASFRVPITVLKAPLGVTANNQSKTYGLNFTFAGTEFTPFGLVNGDTVTNASIASAGAISNAPVAGSPYTITISNALGDAGLTNYIITYTNGEFTVNPAPLGITANSFSKTYGSNVLFAGTEFVSTTLSNLETIGSVTLTSAGAISNAPVSGSPYSITPSAATGGTFTPGNYAITYTNGTLTVNRAGLAVTANNAVRIYGAANPGFSASYSGFVNNESVSVVSGLPGFGTPATVTSGVGGYAIIPSLGTLSASNYSFGPFNNGTLTVNTAPLGITASNLSKTYGQAVTFAGTEFATSGLLNSDTVTHATLTSAGTAATAAVGGSPYSIVPSAATGSGLTNYAITYTNGSLTVNKAALTITANNTNKIVGETLTFAGTAFTASGLQNSETIGSVTLTSAGAPSSAPAGPYSIVPSGPVGGTFSQGNYSNLFVNGTLTVLAPPRLTVTASGNHYVLTFLSVSGQTYQLQMKTNLAVAGWSALGTPINGTGGTVNVTNTIIVPQSFFRLEIGALTVLTPPELTLAAGGNQYVLTFPSVSGQIYQLQTKTNLAVAGWSSVGGPMNGTGGTVNVTNTIIAPQSFFRLQIAP
jgi:mucin-19